ncbi:DBIRD complex subunit ZNF326-like isoform 2-T3 [Spinachia spinachia]
MPNAQIHNESLPNEDYGQCSSPSRGFGKKRCWASSYCEPVNQSFESDFEPDSRPAESQSVSPSNSLAERPGYESISGPLDHGVCKPDRLIHTSSAQMFPAIYGGQMTNGEMDMAVRLSPPTLQQDYQQLKYLRTERDQVSPSTKDSRKWNINIVMDMRPITCDLCQVELANGGELDDHLESKSHWDTLEHIQQQNNYDDLAIAFLQEVMQYKSHQCSRAIEDGALQALQENDHMTKIEMFHCAACSIFVSTSASLVQTHITSQEHLSNIQEFYVQQRRSCLDKAETMMKELRPQFEHFLKGGSPFE